MRKVLSTRKIKPELLRKAADNNVDIVVVEMTEIRFTEKSIDKETITGSEAEITVFTSKNAVRAVAGVIQHTNAELSGKVYCIDGATLSALRNELGHAAEEIAEDAGKLARKIIANEKPQRVTFYCGNRRRDELPDLLRSAGFEVNEIVVYESVINPQKVNGAFEAVVFFSPSAVEGFFLANTIDSNTICYSIGNTTTSEIKKYTANKVFTSSRAAEEEVIELIIRNGKSL